MPTTLQDIAETEAQWLLEQQHPSGGWRAHPGEEPSDLNTAEAVLALLEVKTGVLAAGSQKIADAVKFLVAEQARGVVPGAWERDISDDGRTIYAPDVMRTSLALQALLQGGRAPDDPAVAAAAAWLVAARTPGGLWGYGGATDAAPELLPSCSALAAMVDLVANGAEAHRAHAVDGIAGVLREFGNRDGSFGEGDLQAVHTMHAVLLLQKARKCRVATDAAAETKGLNWIVDNRHAVLQDVEEPIELDRAQPGVNYTFVYMVEALAIKALTDSADDAHRSGPLYRDALIALDKRRSPRGGFYGNRVFSWSTARSIAALSEASRARAEIPRREGASRKERLTVTAFFLVLAAGATGLAAADKLSVILVAFFFLLVLAMLVTFGAISEQGFVETVKSGLGNMRRIGRR